MSVALSPSPVFSWFTPQGLAAAGYQLFTYVAGTSTPQATYTDYTQTTQNLNPVVLNSFGYASVWLVQGETYKLVLEDNLGNLIWSVDQIPGGNALTQSVIGAILYPQTAAEIAAGIVPTSYWYLPGDVRRYGATTGVNCAGSVTAAASCNANVIFPSGAWVISTSPTIPTDVLIQALPGSSFSGTGATGLNLVIVSSYQYNIVEGDAVAGSGFRSVQSIAHSYGGSSMTGGRNSFAVQSSLVATSSPSNTNRNYTAGLFQFNGNTNDNGTNPTAPGTSAGAGFGINPVAILNNTATSWLNVSAGEFNIGCNTGSSVYYRSGIQIVELAGTVQGAIFDIAISVSSQTGAVGWQFGLAFSAANGIHPVTASGSLISTVGAHTVANGVNFSSYTFTGQAFASSGFAVQGGGTEIDLGLGSSFHQILHHTSGAAGYDTRIVSQSGTGTTAAGTLLLNCGAIGFYGASSGAAQATTAGAAATFVQVDVTLPVSADSTFDGYTLKQVVKALRNLALLA